MKMKLIGLFVGVTILSFALSSPVINKDLTDLNNTNSLTSKLAIVNKPSNFVYRSSNVDLRSYSFANTSPQIPHVKIQQIIKRAFDTWSRYTNIDFYEKSYTGNENYVISFVKRRHRDRQPFEGNGGYLAHVIPYGEFPFISIHIDDEENWHFNSNVSTPCCDLFLVAVHEIGHALGLGHIGTKQSIMYSSYQYHDSKNFKLFKRDIEDIQSLYGKRSLPMTTKGAWKTTVPPPTEIPTEPVPPNLCDLKSYDAVTFIREDLFVFSGLWYWRRLKGQTSFNEPRRVDTFWKQLSGDFTAVYENVEQDIVRFFKGKNCWDYSGGNRFLRGPYSLKRKGVKKPIKAAVWLAQSKKTFLFNGNIYWKLGDKKTISVESGPEKRLDAFPKSPKKFQAAFTTSKDKNMLYFLRKTKYYVYDMDLKKVVRSSSFTKDWLAC